MKIDIISFSIGLLLSALSAPIEAGAQVPDTIDIYQCHRSALETHPLQSQKELLALSRDLKQQNHTANWFPSIDLNGKYTWQNEVVELPFPVGIPGFETPLMPHYNYKLTLDVQQTLYDGGMNKKGKELEEAAYQLNEQQVEVNLNQLKSQVNKVYFFVLVLQQQEKTLQLKQDVLDKRIASFESLFRNEALLVSDLNVLKAERLKAGQQMAELEISRKTALKVLGDLTSLQISGSTYLDLPSAEVVPGQKPLLPEHILYDLQIRNLDASIGLVQRKRFPRAYVFGQFGYGNPALNFFRDEFRGYYILGAGLQWNIWDWSKTSREKEVLAVQQDMIRNRKEAFDRNLQIRLEEEYSGILKYQEAIARDLEILELRKQISSAAASQLENGLITSTDYISQLNEEIQARILLDLHRIQLEQARVNYLTSMGTL